MSVMAILTAASDSINDRQKEIARVAGENINLGREGAPRYNDSVGNVWQIYDDERFELIDAARAAVLLNNLNNIPTDLVAEKESVIPWLDSFNPVIPEINDDEDPWAATLIANNAPPVIKMFQNIPDNWTPVEVL